MKKISIPTFFIRVFLISIMFYPVHSVIAQKPASVQTEPLPTTPKKLPEAVDQPSITQMPIATPTTQPKQATPSVATLQVTEQALPTTMDVVIEEPPTFADISDFPTEEEEIIETTTVPDEETPEEDGEWEWEEEIVEEWVDEDTPLEPGDEVIEEIEEAETEEEESKNK